MESKQTGPLGEEFQKSGNKRVTLTAQEFLNKLREADQKDVVYTPVPNGIRLSVCGTDPEDEVFHVTYMPPEQEDFFGDFEKYIDFVREMIRIMDGKGIEVPET